VSLNRYNTRRDANEKDIVDELNKRGYNTWPLDQPADQLVWPKRGGQFGVMEIKDPAQPPSKRKLTLVQQDFFDESSGCPRAKVETIEEALLFAATLQA
jgi:hypothetical protein